MSEITSGERMGKVPVITWQLSWALENWWDLDKNKYKSYELGNGMGKDEQMGQEGCIWDIFVLILMVGREGPSKKF